MSAVNRATVEAVLRQYTDPYLNQDPVSAGCVSAIDIQGDRVSVKLELGYAAALFQKGWAQMLQIALEGLDGVSSAKVDVRCVISAHKAQEQIPALANVKNIVAVASGKGGVGKSTTAANLALALSREGARVGMLDADIYGPSQGVMFGIAEGTRPKIKDQKWFVPIESHGIQVMSMAFLTDDNTPMVWRGPMVSGALLQLITQTAWDDLDYLVIDMPPGTGDIQLTLAQKVPVAGAVIVTTPQDLALLDAKKGVEMFRKVNIPVLGVVENMAIHICSSCGHAEHLFGEGGGEKLAAQYDVELLASLPLSMLIREQADGGKPTVIAEPESQIAMVYQELARHVGARIVLQEARSQAMPSITVSED
ncbi:iron-sulfur cluster carrier protein ApbC [Pseudomonas sp. 10B1]|uniref:iron-sulfur cluster carrier protein ApbC n=1 Tax=unclassified Pseudomonas TaxID=196821 RepID=UPI002AB38A5A|nr:MULTISPECIES: iron-sulfur cluster carrier protein ApbC [unclassified Pseudomonas]MDY7561605.1 iron-sulfur cluster carrier protein ApbC [Pseudomonas sp. AB6]MEA9978380.1 iron-sulfur cluster carrier protein ApbC [Pseudomonas sp. RTS4]MEA9994497.1 iron-sulfur cluster carrier protein ApbC [Pseudomonas sp. AA4]MEB0085641.1 iron-sulfur cluster carrier protein ApbC [Pseudomonas sp. RTI1]MEB0126033.1 iron-sulfur cluster carrier protein ApbC [Pseudomonas sp. CCC1.2]